MSTVETAGSTAPPRLAHPGQDWRGPWVAAAVLAVAGMAVYANSFAAPFVFDGVAVVRSNPAVRHVWPWIFSLGGDHAEGAGRPFGFLTFAINYAWDGYQVRGYHAVNLAIHVAAAWLLFDIVRLTLSRGRMARETSLPAWELALAIALLWLVHPLQTNVVTNLYQRFESLMGLLYLATLWCLIKSLDSPRRVGWLAGSVACCALGMATKEVMITAPVIVLWYDRVFAAGSWRELIRERGGYYAALAATWGVLAGLMFATRAELKTLGVMVGLSPIEYAQSQPGVVLHYLRLAIWPDRLCLDYGWPVAETTADILPPALALAALATLTVWSAIRWPAWGFLGACFFVILAPTSSVAPLKDPAFEHRMYLPLAAVVAVVVLGCYAAFVKAADVAAAGRESSRPALRAGLLAAAALAIVALSWRTLRRNVDYQSEVAIAAATVETAPQNVRARCGLSAALIGQGDFDRAMKEILRAIEIDPDSAVAYNNRGMIYAERSQFDLALNDFNRAVALDTEYATAYGNRGNTQAAMGRLEDAIADYGRALALNPGDCAGYVARGIALAQRGDVYHAVKDFDRAIEFDPGFAPAYFSRALVYYQTGALDLARSDAATATRLGARPSPEFQELLRKASAGVR